MTLCSSYGIIGNKHTVALVSKEGSIDWCCVPLIHSPSVFSAFVDSANGGYFCIKPTSSFTSSQHYIRGTNVIETAFRSDSGTVVLTDFMPIHTRDEEVTNPEIIRFLRCCDGEMEIIIDYYPTFNYGRGWNKISEISGGILARNYDETSILATDLVFSIDNGHARTRFTINRGDEFVLVFCYGIFSPAKRIQHATKKLDQTIQYWRTWINPSQERSVSLHADINRSSLVLRLFTSTQAGVVTEAASLLSVTSDKTISYREGRLARINGTGLTLSSFTRLAHHFEAEVLMKSAEELCERIAGSSLAQTAVIPESSDSIGPVKMKINGADVTVVDNDRSDQWFGFHRVGFLILAVCEYYAIKKRQPEKNILKSLMTIGDLIIKIWDKPDTDFWQKNSEKKQYVFSKVLCWAVLDRIIQLINYFKINADIKSWETVRQDIHKTVLECGYDNERKTFVQAFGSDAVDATALLMPRLGFCAPDDERMVQTLKNIQDKLVEKEYLVKTSTASEDPYVYSCCSLWYADCLSRMKRKNEASAVISRIISLTEPLGLIPEAIDICSECFSGFYPHAYSHAELILSLLNIQENEGNK